MVKMRKLFKERWKFYVATYIIGYLISLKATGIPDILYLIPIKLLAIGLAITLGNAFYHAIHKVPIYSITVKSVKYVLLFIAVCIVFKAAITVTTHFKCQRIAQVA